MKIKVIQTSDGKSRYTDLLDISSNINKLYCMKHGYDYQQFNGIKRGCHDWHSTFNRLYIINEILENNDNDIDWVVYVDADAVVNLFDRKLEDIILHENNIDKLLLICGWGQEPQSYSKINAGVFFLNVKHTNAKNIISAWISLFELIVDKNMLQKSEIPFGIHIKNKIVDDQLLLSILIDILHSFDKIHLIRRYYKYDDPYYFNGDNFISQLLRPNCGMNGTCIDSRIIKMNDKCNEIKNKYNICDSKIYVKLNNMNKILILDEIKKSSLRFYYVNVVDQDIEMLSWIQKHLLDFDNLMFIQ